MASEETLPYGRSSSRVGRTVQDASLEQRSFFAHKSIKKSQQKTASDKLVWFSPVHSPLLSPAREKTLQTAKKKVRNSSIFSIQSRAKGSIEAEEPTSPKVSCIGQVRAYKKDKDPFVDASKKKILTSKPGSMSPARFFASPGRTSKWGSLFGSRKDSGATTSSSGYGGDHQLEKQYPWPAIDGYFDRYTHDAAESHVFGEARAFAVANHKVSLASSYEKSYDLDIHEKHNDVKKLAMSVEANDAGKHAGPEKSFQEQRCHAKPPASKQRLTYEELPSLHCGTFMKPNMKISVEVVPETWLPRNGERLRPASTSKSNCISEKCTSTSREDSQKAQEEEMISPTSPCSKAQPYTREGDGCIDYQLSPSAHVQDKSDLVPVDTGLVPEDSERKNDGQIASASEAGVTLSSCTIMGSCKEGSRDARSLGDEDGANGPQLDKHQALHGEKPKGAVDLEKHQVISGTSEVKNRHRRLRRVSPDVGKENYGIALPQLVDKKLPSLNSTEDRKHQWSIFKGRKSDAFSAQPFSALILVGYDQAIASNDGVKKVSHDEELLKGILEVGRLSFHGSGKYFQVLKGDAEFIRSRSATSYRTVITLQRCNSDPCRPSY